MYPICRMIRVALYQWRKPKLATLTEECVASMRAYPSDCDLNRHINNGRYLTLMDIGRGQLFIGQRMVRSFMGSGLNVVATSAHILFRRSIPLWGRFELHTRIAGIYERFLLIEQRFTYRGKTAAQAYVKIAFVNQSGIVLTEVASNQLGLNLPDTVWPPLPAAAAGMETIDAAILTKLGSSSEIQG